MRKLTSNILGIYNANNNQIDQIARQAHRQLPGDLDYATIDTLSKEAREKLNTVKPLTIGQAARIGGVNPADVNALLLYLELRRNKTPKEFSALV